jgi:DNA ligase 1
LPLTDELLLRPVKDSLRDEGAKVISLTQVDCCGSAWTRDGTMMKNALKRLSLDEESRMFFKPMLAHEYEKHKSKVRFPVIVQPKLDGVRAVWDGTQLWSRNEKPITGVPLIVAELRRCFKDVPLDGEIYCPKMKFDEISGLARQKNNPQVSALQYWAFDFPGGCCYEVRHKKLHDALDKSMSPYIVGLEARLAHDEADIFFFLADFVSMGYEGIMIKDPDAPYKHKRTTALLKLKPWKIVDAIVIGFERGLGKHSERLGAIQVRQAWDEKGWTCSVGTGLSDEEREKIWNSKGLYLGRTLKVKFQEYTSFGNPRFPSFVEFKPLEVSG